MVPKTCSRQVHGVRLDRAEDHLYVQRDKADRAEGPLYVGGDRPDRAEGLVVAWVWAEGWPPTFGTQFV